jgi:hypothetical protein
VRCSVLPIACLQVDCLHLSKPTLHSTQLKRPTPKRLQGAGSVPITSSELCRAFGEWSPGWMGWEGVGNCVVGSEVDRNGVPPPPLHQVLAISCDKSQTRSCLPTLLSYALMHVADLQAGLLELTLRQPCIKSSTANNVFYKTLNAAPGGTSNPATMYTCLNFVLFRALGRIPVWICV